MRSWPVVKEVGQVVAGRGVGQSKAVGQCCTVGGAGWWSGDGRGLVIDTRGLCVGDARMAHVCKQGVGRVEPRVAARSRGGQWGLPECKEGGRWSLVGTGCLVAKVAQAWPAGGEREREKGKILDPKVL